jgi:tRNA threonylcarbamoyladenosine biosynthesis protein TsaE
MHNQLLRISKLTTSAQQTGEMATQLVNIITSAKPTRDTQNIYIFVNGALGAGKTTFTSALAKAFGVTETVTSPTFTLAKFYTSGDRPFLHIDAYRLVTAGLEREALLNELEVTGLQDLPERSICAIEWGETIEPLIKTPHYIINIKANFATQEHVQGQVSVDDSSREIEVLKIAP